MAYVTKKDVVYNALKKDILSGVLEAGEKITISKLAKQFKISEIPVREALNILNSDGLVEFIPHVGATVSSLSTKDIQEIFEIRIVLEGLATRLAAPSIGQNDLIELQELIDQSVLCYEQQDFDEIGKINYLFHMKIYERSNNSRLFNEIKELWSHTKRYPSLFKHNTEHVKRSIEEHREIKNALEKEDGVLAEKIMLQHKAKAAEEIIRIKERKYYRSLQKN